MCLLVRVFALRPCFEFVRVLRGVRLYLVRRCWRCSYRGLACCCCCSCVVCAVVCVFVVVLVVARSYVSCCVGCCR